MTINKLINICVLSGLVGFFLAAILGATVLKEDGRTQKAILRILFVGAGVIFIVGFLLSTFKLLVGFELIRLS